LTRRLIWRIATTEAAFVAASVLPVIVLVGVLGSGVLPVDDVVRVSFEKVEPVALSSALVELQRVHPEVEAFQQGLGGDVVEIVVTRDLSWRPGGDPSISEILDVVARAGRLRDVSTGPEISDGESLAPWLPLAYGYVMFLTLGVMTMGLLRRFPVQAPRGIHATWVRTGAAALVAWIALLTVGWGATQLPEMLPPPVNSVSIGTTLAAAGVVGFVFACLIAPWAEELLFRKWLYGGLLQDEVKHAGLIQAAVFAIPHAPVFGLRGAVGAFIAGLIFAWLYRTSGRILLPAAVHGAYNGSILATQHLW
jgi:membrane protease YdiL (CAAX protease family)